MLMKSTKSHAFTLMWLRTQHTNAIHCTEPTSAFSCREKGCIMTCKNFSNCTEKNPHLASRNAGRPIYFESTYCWHYIEGPITEWAKSMRRKFQKNTFSVSSSNINLYIFRRRWNLALQWCMSNGSQLGNWNLKLDLALSVMGPAIYSYKNSAHVYHTFVSIRYQEFFSQFLRSEFTQFCNHFESNLRLRLSINKFNLVWHSWKGWILCKTSLPL